MVKNKFIRYIWELIKNYQEVASFIDFLGVLVVMVVVVAALVLPGPNIYRNILNKYFYNADYL